MNLVSKGCIYHLVQVNDKSFEVSSLHLVSMVKQFPEVFPDYIPGVPHEREIDFGIDIIPNTRPISILQYGMTSKKLK